MKNISVQEFKKILQAESSNKAVDFIDVCSEMEYKENHIQGVRNIPLNKLAQHIEDLKSKKTLYIHCFSGSRSQLAVSILASYGVTAELVNVDGGILAWHRAGFPVVNG